MAESACSLESYCERVPEENRWKLAQQVDFEHGDVPTHLGTIADRIDQWEGRVSEALGLSTVEVSAIKTRHPDELNLQTREALHRWQEKHGLTATYRNLIDVFLKAEKTSYAEAVCRVLGMDSKYGSVSSPSDHGVAMSRLSIDDKTNTSTTTGSQGEATPKRSYDKEKKELLKKNLAKIKESFAKVKRQVLRILKAKDIDMDEFIDFVTGLVTSPECIPEDAEKIVTIFQAITKNLLWSHFDYELLKTIAKEFAKEETSELIVAYERDLSSFYATTKLADFISLCQDEDIHTDPEEPLAPNPAKYNREHYQKLTLKIGRQITVETLQYVDDLWKSFARFFGLPSLMVLLDHIMEGSLVISWIIPKSSAEKIRAECRGNEAEAAYRLRQIIEVTIDGDCLYFFKPAPDSDPTKLAWLEACKEGNLTKVLGLLEQIADWDFSQYANTPLTAAVVNVGYGLEVIQTLLRYQMDINGRQMDDRTALMIASWEGRTDVVELLLKHHADVNARKKDDWTALMLASQEGRTDVVELLLKHHADVNARDEDGWTALMSASKNGRTDVVELLLKHHADVNARDEDGMTALMLASQEGRTDVVELLLKHHADVNARNKLVAMNNLTCKNRQLKNGWTALMVASQEGRTDVVELLLKHHADMNARKENGWTALMSASMNGRTDVVELLLKHHADVNARREDGWTALMAASLEGRTDVVELLMKHHADVNARTENGVTALMVASMNGRTDVVELLLKHHAADVNARENDGFAALTYATQKGHVGSVRALLEAGADTNMAENETLWTPLFFASKDGNLELVTLLVEHGAVVDFKDKNGITPLDTARTYDHTEVVDLLMALSMSMETEKQTIIASGEVPAQLSEETKIAVLRAGEYNDKLLREQMAKIAENILNLRKGQKETTGKGVRDIDRPERELLDYRQL